MKCMRRNIIYLLSMMSLMACNESKKTLQWEEKYNSHQFDTVVSMETYPVVVEELMNIEEWNIVDTTLICKNSGDNPFYYVFNTTDFCVTGKFGRKGNGENEWLSPHLIPITDTTYTVIDNMRWGIYNVAKVDSSYIIQKKKDMGVQIPLNSIKPVSSSAFGYISYSSREVSWRIADMEDLSCTDSIVFFDENVGDNSMLYDFSYDVSFGHAVFAYYHLDGFVIASMLDANRMKPIWALKGDGAERMKDDVYYTDVLCGEKNLYLLSQREVKMSDYSGTSSLEIYDYEGNPVKKVILNIIASNMVYDKINKRVVFRSFMDNDLHVLDYAFE